MNGSASKRSPTAQTGTGYMSKRSPVSAIRTSTPIGTSICGKLGQSLALRRCLIALRPFSEDFEARGDGGRLLITRATQRKSQVCATRIFSGVAKAVTVARQRVICYVYSMREKIEAQIDSARLQLQEAELVHVRLKSRLETLEEMLAMLPREQKVRRATTGGRSLSEPWKSVISSMASLHPDGADYEEIFALTQDEGIGLRKENLRGHMGNYKAAGYVDAIRPGLFVITEHGKKVIGIVDYEKQEADGFPSASDNLGPVTGRGTGYPPNTPEGSIPSGSTHISSESSQKKPNVDDEIPF